MTANLEVLEPTAMSGPTPAAAQQGAPASTGAGAGGWAPARTSKAAAKGKSSGGSRSAGNAFAVLADLDAPSPPATPAPSTAATQDASAFAADSGTAPDLILRVGTPPDAWDV